MMDDPARILLIEDNPGDARLVKEALGTVGAASFQLAWMKNLAKGLAYLEKNPIDAILLDLSRIAPASQRLKNCMPASRKLRSSC
jgi:CheY-like chemotaxis protein